jgi:hypothetical protein
VLAFAGQHKIKKLGDRFFTLKVSPKDLIADVRAIQRQLKDAALFNVKKSHDAIDHIRRGGGRAGNYGDS